ncbi:MAG: hypothetical protein BAJALOKI1v1_20016 [Promethearchaeota archaeon]|nr:MAG: hypothetical protein BAJALOKI1v1_20016 [Candidatus Lokiarchaeota archaeon]
MIESSIDLMQKENLVAKLINPNLGHPIFINSDSKKRRKSSLFSKIKRVFKRKRKLKNHIFEARLLFVSNVDKLEEFKDHINNTVNLIPILEERKVQRKFLFKLRNFFRKEKIAEEQKLFFEKAPEKYSKAIRGASISVKIREVEAVKEKDIDSEEYLINEYCSPAPYFSKWNTFNKLTQYYCVNIEFNLSKEVLEFLKLRTFVMFDIGYRDHYNYHSLVITKQKWENFAFIQITDTHLAERNDRIFGIVSKWKKTTDESIFGKIAHKIKCLFNIGDNNEENGEIPSDGMAEGKVAMPKNTPREGSENDEEGEDCKEEVPLEKRLINANNQLRKFIKIANKRIQKNNLDFIVITGDIVDFVIKSRYALSGDELDKLKYKKSNWKVFKDIILNLQPENEYEEVISGEELLCPIFTIVGNHDFRPNCYDFNWGGLYKKIGLKAFEATALNEVFSASPITALSKSKLALKHYLSEICPSLDYTIQLGNFNFIFLNSGSDSFKNIRDLAAGHPSVTGLKASQVRYLRNLLRSKISQENKNILLIHGPPINIGKKQYFKKRIKTSSSSEILQKLEDFKESLARKLGIEDTASRLDSSYNVKFGTISKNWDKLIHFCLNHTILTLSGHTHLTKEFRLEETKNKTTVFDAPPFFLKRIEIPAAIYYDIYSEIYSHSFEIKKKIPFIVQTPALGLASYKKPDVVGGYRVIRFKNGELHSFKVKYLHQSKSSFLDLEI